MKHSTAVMILSLTLGFTSVARAEKFSTACPDLSTCAKNVGALIGQNYVFTPDIKGTLSATESLELTKENAEVLFTKLLEANGYTRIPIGGSGNQNTYQILRMRDARDSAIPSYSASKAEAPELPSHWDLVTMRYKVQSPEIVDELARTLRSFLPAYARIIPVSLGGYVLVTCSAQDAMKVYQLLKDNDVKPSPDLLKELKERRKAGRDMERKMNEQRMNPPSKPGAEPRPGGPPHP